MQIFVDADACPVVDIVEMIAEKYNIPATLLCDTNHVLYSDYSEVIVVGTGADAVDYKLISICHKGDIVVSQDYGVAAMALGKGAYAIHQSGKWYTDENIDRMLMERHLNKKARRGSSKNHIKGPKKRTPIGNLEDITLRVLRVLKEVDLIAAEDTRNSIKLLNHFDIKTPMTSYHEYNKVEKAYTLIEKMQEGLNVALITDAGTPGISDPGEVLAAMCYDAGIEVTSLPGPAACITALTLSGLSTRRFAFEAFLPPDKKERKAILEELKNETRTIILYEAPHHLVGTLQELYQALGNRRMTLCRELTKKYETAFRTTIEDLIAFYKDQKPLGECVLVIEGRSRKEMEQESQESWRDISIEEHMAIYENQGIARKEAMKMVAKDRGVTKRDIYQALLLQK